MFKFLKLNIKYHKLVRKLVSSIVFIVVFFCILFAAEWVYPNNVLNNMMYYIKTYLLMGIK